jgi:thiosulfate/3-mercaptopyruvate sulfurtransferase
MPVLDADEAAALADGEGVLLDARAAERYRGEVEPVDPQAGHIPGAASAPTAGNLRADGRFLPTADLKRRFGDLGVSTGAAGVRQVGVYCGSGVTASHEVAALAVAGVDAALYPGSWSQWSNDPAREVATGA